MNMANTTYNIRIDEQVKKQADDLFKSMGLSLSSAINLFLKQSVVQGRLPISEVIAEPFYADVVLRDARSLDIDIQNGTSTVYATPKDLFAAWDAEDSDE